MSKLKFGILVCLISFINFVDHNIYLNVFSLGGQQNNIRHFYRGAWGYIIAYSVDNRESYEKAKFYLEDVKKSLIQSSFNSGSKNQVGIILVGNKTDLTKAVPTAEAKVRMLIILLIE